VLVEAGRMRLAGYSGVLEHDGALHALSTCYALPVKFNDIEWYVVEELRRQNHPADSLQFFHLGKNALQIDCPRIGFEFAPASVLSWPKGERKVSSSSFPTARFRSASICRCVSTGKAGRDLLANLLAVLPLCRTDEPVDATSRWRHNLEGAIVAINVFDQAVSFAFVG
jgi:hypothetical protein